jgi:phosphate transport system protein
MPVRLNSQTHLEESLQLGIDRIRTTVTEMAERGERALKLGLQALMERNRQLAYSVILQDHYIDELETELDRLCLEFLVRQQPVGSHLRFVFAAIKINKELERIGDYAESIARQVLIVSNFKPPLPYEKFDELANLAVHMFHDTVHAFLSGDSDLARRTMSIEERADTLRNRINAELMELQRDKKIPLETLSPLLTIARRFERVTDQSKNICEEVLYMCTGEFIRHPGSEAFRLLFVDGANACLSQMAEAIGTAQNAPRFVFGSAGLAPREVEARTMKFLAGKGHDVSRLTAKSLDQVQDLEHQHVIVALSAEAKQAFPPHPTKTLCLVWTTKDPAQAQGAAEEVNAAFEEAYRFLSSQIQDLVRAIQGNQPTPSIHPIHHA